MSIQSVLSIRPRPRSEEDKLGRHSISLVIFCMVFGFLIGLAGFLGMAFLGGFVETEEAEAVAAGPQYASATEHLEKYRCRSVEEKRIFMGGIEDGYDPAGDEPAVLSESLENHLDDLKEFYAQVPGERTKAYDDPAQDRYFVDIFDIPKRTFHGMIALRMEDLSSISNDGMRIGYMKRHTLTEEDAIYQVKVSDVQNIWSTGNNYVWADLNDLKISKYENNKDGIAVITGLTHNSLLDAIRLNGDKPLQVEIADDTIVDFVGFALCLEPADHRGSVFSRSHILGAESTLNFGDGFVSLYGNSPTSAGNLSCEERRPLACINDQNLKAPDVFTEYTNIIWSGGYIKFTPPVKGNKFKTEDDVDAYCASEFGEAFRSVNMKDGTWMGAMVGLGTYPEGYDDFWAGYKDSPHHNCWSLRQDYDDLARLEAQE